MLNLAINKFNLMNNQFYEETSSSSLTYSNPPSII